MDNKKIKIPAGFRLNKIHFGEDDTFLFGTLKNGDYLKIRLDGTGVVYQDFRLKSGMLTKNNASDLKIKASLDTSELDKQIAEMKSKLEELKKSRRTVSEMLGDEHSGYDGKTPISGTITLEGATIAVGKVCASRPKLCGYARYAELKDKIERLVSDYGSNIIVSCAEFSEFKQLREMIFERESGVSKPGNAQYFPVYSGTINVSDSEIKRLLFFCDSNKTVRDLSGSGCRTTSATSQSCQKRPEISLSSFSDGSAEAKFVVPLGYTIDEISISTTARIRLTDATISASDSNSFHRHSLLGLKGANFGYAAALRYDDRWVSSRENTNVTIYIPGCGKFHVVLKLKIKEQ